ncbi:MAG: 50S ribosomal protein L32 [Firmicutes bacterium]|nr:50S ribosomal protein L32 [Bacillota bacterium]
MAVPFRRTSKTKKRMRRTHLKKTARTVLSCPNCGEPIQAHRACTKCGFYKGKNVLNREDETPVVKEEKEVKAAKKETVKKTSTKKATKSKETK